MSVVQRRGSLSPNAGASFQRHSRAVGRGGGGGERLVCVGAVRIDVPRSYPLTSSSGAMAGGSASVVPPQFFRPGGAQRKYFAETQASLPRRLVRAVGLNPAFVMGVSVLWSRLRVLAARVSFAVGWSVGPFAAAASACAAHARPGAAPWARRRAGGGLVSLPRRVSRIWSCRPERVGHIRALPFLVHCLFTPFPLDGLPRRSAIGSGPAIATSADPRPALCVAPGRRPRAPPAGGAGAAWPPQVAGPTERRNARR